MPPSSIEFGYLPDESNFQAGPISVSTLPGLSIKVAAVENSALVDDDWVYAPRAQSKNFFIGAVTSLPFVSRVFGLPKTHVLTHAATDSAEHLRFHVWCLGFFVGVRLTGDEAGFLDATPVKRGKLSDFSLAQGQMALAVSLADSFWLTNFAHYRRTTRLEGIIHALFLAQHPQHLEFERFMYLYTALDACYALTESIKPAPKKLSHSARIEWMCQQFDIPVPQWATQSKLGTQLSVVRNDTFHEALFFEQPLGFSLYGAPNVQVSTNVPLEMQALVSRLLVALLGSPKCEYVQSPVDSRQRYRLDLS